LLVFSRIRNIDRDKELRFKIQALQEAKLRDFGVSPYLLLNDQTPILDLAIKQEQESVQKSYDSFKGFVAHQDLTMIFSKDNPSLIRKPEETESFM
jgi:hypothetical protein